MKEEKKQRLLKAETMFKDEIINTLYSETTEDESYVLLLMDENREAGNRIVASLPLDNNMKYIIRRKRRYE